MTAGRPEPGAILAAVGLRDSLLALQRRARPADLSALLKGGRPGAFDDRYLQEVAGARSYVIAFEERSGSTMLCSLLQKTGKLGRPDEFLNPRGPVQMYLGRSNARDLDQYFGYLRHEHSTSNGWFGMKATYPDFAPLIRAEAVGRLLGDVRFIHLIRRDLLRQAISSALARKRDFWHAYAGKRALPEDAGADPEPDTGLVLRLMQKILEERQGWERFFALYGIEPLRIAYEDLVDDRVATLDAIFAFLGVQIEARTFLAESETARLSNDTNDRWLDDVRRRHRL
jgi:LPS sulfotransferase NodH